MSDAPQLLPLRTTLASRWQVPVLAIGLLLFGSGLLRAALTHKPIGFEDELARVQTLVDAHAWERATAYLNNLLKDPNKTSEQQGTLHRLLAMTTYRAESARLHHNSRNLQYIIYNYQAAAKHGVQKDVQDWVALADTYHWRGDDTQAVDSYRRALELSPPRSDRLRRKMIELQMKSGGTLDADILTEMKAIIEPVPEELGKEYSPSPVNYLWALEQIIEWHLEQGDIEQAKSLVADGEKDLEGTSERLALNYLSALCLFETGQPESAQVELEALLDQWGVHDELWAKTLWLLGRIQQQDDRPQAAMSLYEDVLGGFQAGDVKDACELGRAECLAALERYDRAFEMFSGIRDRLLSREGAGYLDPDAVRLTLTAIADGRLKADEGVLAVAYFRMALSLLDASQSDMQRHYLAQIAGTLGKLADAKTAEGTAEAVKEAESLHSQAAEEYLQLSTLGILDEGASAMYLEKAADHFEAAGQTDRFVEMLSLFIREHKTSDRYVRTLYRLGRAYQAAHLFRDAAGMYEEAVNSFSRTPFAMQSIVPLAECLIHLGGEDTRRGVRILIDIVDDRGPDQLFSPQAREYKAALFRLVDYYCHATEDNVPNHFEEAIRRIESAITFFPEAEEMPRLKFQLADAYRRSSLLLGDEVDTLASPESREAATAESLRRLKRSLEVYSEVVSALASSDVDTLSDLEQTYLRASYLYRGDCLLDIGDYEAAIEAYREAAWRYENHPTTVAASMQIVHCFQRLGKPDEARAALARLRWLLKKIPESSFDTQRGMSSKVYWETMVARLEQTGLF